MINPDELKTELRRLGRGLLHHNTDTVWVENNETMFDALGQLYEKLDGGDLQYAIDVEDTLQKAKEARESGLITETKDAQ